MWQTIKTVLINFGKAIEWIAKLFTNIQTIVTVFLAIAVIIIGHQAWQKPEAQSSPESIVTVDKSYSSGQLTHVTEQTIEYK